MTIKVASRREERLPDTSPPLPPDPLSPDPAYDSRWLSRRVSELRSGPALRPSDLNDLFAPTFLSRRRAAASKPLSAHGAIFDLEGSLVDAAELHRRAWGRVCGEHGYPTPSLQEAAKSVLYLTSDFLEMRKLGMAHYNALGDVFAEAAGGGAAGGAGGGGGMWEVREGAERWLETLREEEVPVCLYSKLDKEKVQTILASTNLTNYFPPENLLTPEEGYSTLDQTLLGSALLIRRPPTHCTVYADSPAAAIAAHDAEMRCVGVSGAFPRYELQVADQTVSSLGDLKTVDVRRVFSDMDDPAELEMVLQKEPEGKRTRNERPRWEY
ncbi:hypothetical protein TeGR_g8693 [Tetraparma gracilis]|uniref:Uncharacterized protein n=1 Tax=Tetraparma gracilis TaxID=2962635 RepID=A0ABQ6MX97_9STRA|nr:hypothetical protein TeGR_g8693 [Tetraparma gracilis]